MHRFARKGLTLSAFIGMLSACATLQWSTIFSWENGFGAIPAVVHPGTDGGILLAGGVRTNFDDSGGLPVLHHDRVGRKLLCGWGDAIGIGLGENFAFLYEGGVESLVTSSDGSLYVGSHQNDIAVLQSLIPKGEPSGNVNSLKIQRLSLRSGIKRQPDYNWPCQDISSQGPDELVAFDTNGNELWRYSGVGRQDPEDYLRWPPLP